jgi:hypothetical protein
MQAFYHHVQGNEVGETLLQTSKVEYGHRPIWNGKRKMILATRCVFHSIQMHLHVLVIWVTSFVILVTLLL